MDKPADPATPFAEVYQAFYSDLAQEGTKPSTIARYRCNIGRFEQWLVENGHPVTLAALERTILNAYRQYLETLPQQPRGSIRRRRGGLMSSHKVHSYLRSIKCLASWLKGGCYINENPFLAVNAYYKKKGVMPVLRADDRIPKIGKPADVAILLHGCVGDEPEDLRDRALVWLLYSSGVRAADAIELTIPAIDFETGVLFIASAPIAPTQEGADHDRLARGHVMKDPLDGRIVVALGGRQQWRFARVVHGPEPRYVS